MNRKQSDTNQNNQMALLSHTGINQPVARAPIKSSKVCFAEFLMCQCFWCKCKCLHSSCINETIVPSSRTGNEAMHANAFGFHIIDKQQLYLQVLHTFHPNFPMQPRVCHALNHPAFEPHLFFDRI